MDQLDSCIRHGGKRIRASGAPNDMCVRLGAPRAKANSTRKSAPTIPPEFELDNVIQDAINVRFREAGSASPRARAQHAIGVQVAVVDAANPVTDGEADAAPNIFPPRCPAQLDSTRMPSKARLCARWVIQRGDVSPWSGPLTVTVL